MVRYSRNFSETAKEADDARQPLSLSLALVGDTVPAASRAPASTT